MEKIRNAFTRNDERPVFRVATERGASIWPVMQVADSKPRTLIEESSGAQDNRRDLLHRRSRIRMRVIGLALCLGVAMGTALRAQTPGADRRPAANDQLAVEVLELSRALNQLQNELRQSGVGPGLAGTIKQTQQNAVDLAALKEQARALAERAGAGTAGGQPIPANVQEALDKLAPLLEAGGAEGLTAVAKSGVDIGKISVSASTVWVLVTAVLVMFMQAGFALVETGLTRAKNAAHTMTMNFMVYAIGLVAFWVCGFAFMFGGVGANPGLGIGDQLNTGFRISLAGKEWSLIGLEGFCLSGDALFHGGIAALFLFQMAFADTASTIPTGAMAERWRLPHFALFSFFVVGVIYPIFGHWVWGGGWLASLGYYDFAGSSVVHMCGGLIALTGAKLLGPRLGKYNPDGTSNPIPGHNISFVVIGTFILAFGWFGFNAGSTLNAIDVNLGNIATNTALASAGGAVAAFFISASRFGKPDPSFCCNGMLGGLVAITAPCAFVDSWAAVVIGIAAGIIVIFSVSFVEEILRVDDPVGAVSVHCVCGMWGVLAVGIFGNGKYLGVTGLVAGGTSQIGIQAIGIVACIAFVVPATYIAYKLIAVLVPARSSDEDQYIGLDVPETGVEAYAPDVTTSQN
jgi:Amt family ammonium transporter